jgi:hypothetical protein
VDPITVFPPRILRLILRNPKRDFEFFAGGATCSLVISV